MRAKYSVVQCLLHEGVCRSAEKFGSEGADGGFGASIKSY